MSLEGLDLNLLLVLHHALAEGSVVAAARRLHVTPSAVSNRLARLRALLGDPLLVRHGRALVLTPRGRELAPRVAEAVAGLRGLLERPAAFDPAACTRRFTVASADNLGLLPGLVERFGRRLPRATLRVVTLDHGVASEGLASGEVDLLLGLPPALGPEEKAEPAYRDRLVCAWWADAAGRAGRLTLARYLQARHVEVALQGRYPIDLVDAALAERGERRVVAVSVPSFTTAALCLVGTDLVAMLPRQMARRLRHWMPLRLATPPFPLPAVTVQQVWHARGEGDPALALLRELVQQAGARP